MTWSETRFQGFQIAFVINKNEVLKSFHLKTKFWKLFQNIYNSEENKLFFQL